MPIPEPIYHPCSPRIIQILAKANSLDKVTYLLPEFFPQSERTFNN